MQLKYVHVFIPTIKLPTTLLLQLPDYLHKGSKEYSLKSDNIGLKEQLLQLV